MKRNLAALSCHIRHLVLHFNSLRNSTLGNIKETDEGHVNPQKTSSLTHLLLIFNIPSSWHCNSSVRMPAGPCKIQHLYWIPAIIQQDHLGHLIYIGKSKKNKKQKRHIHALQETIFHFTFGTFGNKCEIIHFNLFFM